MPMPAKAKEVKNLRERVLEVLSLCHGFGPAAKAAAKGEGPLCLSHFMRSAWMRQSFEALENLTLLDLREDWRDAEDRADQKQALRVFLESTSSGCAL